MKPKLESSRGKKFPTSKKVTIDDIFRIGRNTYLIIFAVACVEVMFQ